MLVGDPVQGCSEIKIYTYVFFLERDRGGRGREGMLMEGRGGGKRWAF